MLIDLGRKVRFFLGSGHPLPRLLAKESAHNYKTLSYTHTHTHTHNRHTYTNTSMMRISRKNKDGSIRITGGGKTMRFNMFK